LCFELGNQGDKFYINWTKSSSYILWCWGQRWANIYDTSNNAGMIHFLFTSAPTAPKEHALMAQWICWSYISVNTQWTLLIHIWIIWILYLAHTMI